MTNPLLKQASDLIERHIQTLNTERAECACCGMVKYENFNDFRSHTELTAIVNKLRNRLRNG